MSAYCALIVGAGMIGSGYDTPDDENVLTHAHAFHRHPDFEPACFVEPDREKARKAVSVWGGRAYGSLDEAFSGQAFDVVSVCTPTTTHRDVLLDVLGRDIKCVIHEKPLAADMDEAAELMEACGSSPVPVMVNYTRRYMKEMIGIRARIAKGEFGSFVSGSCYYGKGILNNGSHAVDLLRYLIGEVEDVSYVSGRVDYLPQDPSVSCVLGISGGGSF
ncbi:MAG: Gfo/Idh/MocA family oxidoreductase, partial [Thermodesulfovibrionales bacterium]|nr:Gfo/Idh/MocA family oxidoreductase [Thermodesulfovibrionales bacterium]